MLLAGAFVVWRKGALFRPPAGGNDEPPPTGLVSRVRRFLAPCHVKLGEAVAYLGSTIGVISVDIKTPGKPRYLGLLALRGSVSGLAWASGKLVAALGPDGIVVVEASDPAKLKKLSALRLAGLVRLDRSVVKWAAPRRAVTLSDRLRTLRDYIRATRAPDSDWKQVARSVRTRHGAHLLSRK